MLIVVILVRNKVKLFTPTGKVKYFKISTNFPLLCQIFNNSCVPNSVPTIVHLFVDVNLFILVLTYLG